MTAAAITTTRVFEIEHQAVNPNKDLKYGMIKEALFSLAIAGDYATGGVAWDLSSYFSDVQHVGVEPYGGYVGFYDYNATIASAKLLLYYGDYSSSSDGVLIEPNGVTLALTAVRVRVLGYAKR